MSIKTVLFDLDGTLIDTAPDLADALNFTLRKNNYPVLSLEQIRPHVSNGSIALVEFGFNIDSTNQNFEHYRNELLDYYTENIANKSRLFPEFNEVLETIETRGLNWGIVTNKPSYLTIPLLKKLNLEQRAATIVSSDTLEFRKPHPAPMLHACKEAGSKPSECIFIGDAQRDVEAGINAKITSLVALFGYIGNNDNPKNWGADGYIHCASDIIDYLDNFSG
ncbi:Similar to phosphoglycolate phosphatase, clustered with ubiquinone biosynthesis SAM-dependent O-methyltransferase [hydrothermal vent metagenome]|uniref:Similar to phosphoglycolate phosphatase, clustered with ubiquinone biosynthesis SAM-dependent O-methyltransferase n=1 Tax=hydrothermal vent metagenome TaxID=652676 RepID=A0A3B1ALR2_9ZZZZ